MPMWFGPLLVLMGGVCIGMAPIGLRFGLDDLGAQAVAMWRYIFATPILFLLLVITQRRLPQRVNKFIIIAGICFALDIGLWHWSLTLTTVANATFMVNLGNLGVGLAAWIFLKERPSPMWGLAVLIALVGAAALSLGGGADGKASLRGDLLAVGAAILVSGYMVAAKVARQSISAIDAIFWLTVVEVFVAVALVAISGEAWFPADISGFAAPLFLALTVQILGQGLIIAGLGHTPAALAGILVVVQPVVAAALSWHLFDEPLAPIQGGGAVLILIGIILAQSGNRKPAREAVS